jgi:hypothetical protein
LAALLAGHETGGILVATGDERTTVGRHGVAVAALTEFYAGMDWTWPDANWPSVQVKQRLGVEP